MYIKWRPAISLHFFSTHTTTTNMMLAYLLLLQCLYCLSHAAIVTRLKTRFRTHTKTLTSVTSVTTTSWSTHHTTVYRSKTTPYTETPASTPTVQDTAFATEALQLHNAYRAKHKAPALKWSDELYQTAQKFANSYVCNGILKHSDNSYGENLALGYNTSAAIGAWYDEVSIYNFDNPGFSSATGHFTQLVWKNTTDVGCAYIICGDYFGQYTICNYSPLGNIDGEYRENVIQ